MKARKSILIKVVTQICDAGKFHLTMSSARVAKSCRNAIPLRKLDLAVLARSPSCDKELKGFSTIVKGSPVVPVVSST